jgi:hypothetical protein
VCRERFTSTIAASAALETIAAIAAIGEVVELSQ